MNQQVLDIISDIDELIGKWSQTARYAFVNAKAQDDNLSRRFIEHGAVCTSNCVFDLKALREKLDALKS